MRLILWITISLHLIAVQAFAQSKKRISVVDYVYAYKDAAITEMKRSGIPASITLSQGMLESDNGNSRLARDGNNHFGIKCHNWSSDGIYIDDDAKNECFRKYKSANESFRDHTDFLLTRQRYSSLFEYKTTDYKNWAKGLKRAGYATNAKYADLLIKLINENKLHQYDQDFVSSKRSKNKQFEKAKSNSKEGDFTISLNRPVFKRNNIEYVVAKNGDGFEKLSRELDMFTWELLKYNELTKDSVIHDGQILFLQPKHRRAERGKDVHTAMEGETIYSISQLYGVKSSRLLRLNHLSETDNVKTGDIVHLRWRKKG